MPCPVRRPDPSPTVTPSLLLVLALCLAAAWPAFVEAAGERPVVRLMHRAAEERKKGDYVAAAGTYREVLRMAPQLFEAHLFLADTLRKRRLDAEAEQEFQAARRLRPADPLPYASLAEMRREKFRYGEALDILADGWNAVDPPRREILVVGRGTLLRESGREEESVELLREGTRDFPESSRIPENLARSLEALGRLSEALDAWKAAASRAPEDPSLPLELNQAQELQRRLEKAEAAVRLPGARARVWAELARLRDLARQYPEAADAALAALRLSPERSDLMLLRGLALERAGRREEAAAQLGKIGIDAPEHLLSLYHRAYLARLKKDDALEEKIWRTAVEQHPRDAAAQLMLVLDWKRRSLLKSRIKSLRAERRRKKSLPALRIVEGMALEESGRDREAEELYEALFLEEPRNPESSARLSGLLALRPELLAARLAEESARHARPGGEEEPPARHLLLAQLLVAAGRGDAAAKEVKEAAASFPDREEIQLGLASVLATVGGDPREIDAALDRALELSPESPWAHLEKGLWLLQRGGIGGGGEAPSAGSSGGKENAGEKKGAGGAQEAIGEAERVVALAPRMPEGHQLLGVARRQAGDLPGAVRELQTALLMDPADSPGVVRFQLALTLAALQKRLQAEAVLEGDLPPFPDLVYRMAWSFVRRTFLDRSFRGQDWLSWRDRSPAPGADPSQAFAAVAEMLDSLKDPYTRLRSLEETASLYLQPRSGSLETDASGAPLPSSASVVTRDLGGNIGYIRLTNFSDPSAREAVRRALERMARRDGLVLDLRGNPGGQTADADAIAGLLLEPGEELGRERTRFGEGIRRSPQTRSILPRTPLVVLTDRRTGSAAEKLAAGLQGSGRATVVGEETFGKGVGQLTRLLPGGGMVLVTALENLSRQGRSLQGRGVVPDVSEPEDESLEKAKELLKKPNP